MVDRPISGTIRVCSSVDWQVRQGLQLVAGLAIVLDIIDEDRRNNLSDAISESLGAVTRPGANAVGMFRSVIVSYLSHLYFLMYYKKWLERIIEADKATKDLQSTKLGYTVWWLGLDFNKATVFVVALIAAGFWGYEYFSGNVTLSYQLLWRLPVSLLWAFIARGLVFGVIIIVIAVASSVILLPVKMSLNGFFKLVKKVLDEKGLVQPVLVLSLILFVLGTLMDLVAS